jgi:hypothetical protein
MKELPEQILHRYVWRFNECSLNDGIEEVFTIIREIIVGGAVDYLGRKTSSEALIGFIDIPSVELTAAQNRPERLNENVCSNFMDYEV